MREFKEILKAHGLTMSDAVHAGISRQTVWFHWHGKRKVSCDSALIYERALGIPRSELRPDLWPQNMAISQDILSDGNGKS